MDAIELGVLEACGELVRRQQELLPLLAEGLKVPQDQIFYTWAFRRCDQHGSLKGTDWAYFFHGMECDIKNVTDGRFVRMDFGPRGRLGTFTAWGVLQFIMTSVTPWPEYPELKAYFATRLPPYDQYSGSFEKIGDVWDSLESKSTFEQADANLVALQASYTSPGPNGLLTVRFPPGTPEETIIDSSVAHRPRLSPVGLQMLKTHVARSPSG